MKRLIVALALCLAGCASQIGSLAGTATVSVTCDTGTIASYSQGLIPQMQGVTAACVGSDGKTHSSTLTPGIDIATIAALVKQNMAAHGEIVVAPRQQGDGNL